MINTNDSRVVMWQDYRRGDALDISPNGNNGTFENVSLNRDGFRSIATGSNMSIPHNANMLNNEMTLILYNPCGFYSAVDGATNPRLFDKRNAAGTNRYDFYYTNTSLVFDNAGTVSFNAKALTGEKLVAISFKSGEVPTFYAIGDTFWSGAGNLALTIDQDVTNAAYIGNNQSKSNPTKCVGAFMWLNGKITDSEMSQIYGQLANAKFPTKQKATVLEANPNDLTDGDMEASGVTAWPVVSGTRVKTTAEKYEGTQSLMISGNGTSQFPYVYQASLVIGKTYRLTGALKRGTSPSVAIKYVAGAPLFTTFSTEWEAFSVEFTPTDTRLVIQLNQSGAGASETGYVDDLVVTEVGKTYNGQWKTDFGTHVSVSNVTSGYLENSPFRVLTGTFKVVSDTINGKDIKAIECIGDGTLQFPTYLGDSDFTGWVDTGSGYVEGALTVTSSVCTLTTGDKIALSDITGNYAIIKTL